jgi:lipopolysaccharide biosynthesis glycosyltransferase
VNNAIVMIFDENFADYARTCINSIKINYKEHPVILAMYTGNNENTINQMNSIAGIKLILWSKEFDKLIGLNAATVNLGHVNYDKMYYKYILWTHLFDEYDKVLYLDVDILVIKSLNEVFTFKNFFSVSDYTSSPEYRVFYPAFVDDPVLRSLLEKDNLPFPGGKNDMLNAGMFMIPKNYRNEYYLEQLLYITHTYNDYMMFADQSAISLWCHLNKIEITKNWRYNFQLCFYNYNFSAFIHEEDIHIVHFSWCKPDSEMFQSFQTKFEHFFKMCHLLKFCREATLVESTNESKT